MAVRVYDLGIHYNVSIGESEIYAFRQRWPASGLSELRSLTGQFSKRNGDLVAIWANGREDSGRFDGDGLVALLDDMQCYGEYKLRLQDRCVDQSEKAEWRRSLGTPSRRVPRAKAGTATESLGMRRLERRFR